MKTKYSIFLLCAITVATVLILGCISTNNIGGSASNNTATTTPAPTVTASPYPVIKKTGQAVVDMIQQGNYTRKELDDNTIIVNGIDFYNNPKDYTSVYMKFSGIVMNNGTPAQTNDPLLEATLMNSLYEIYRYDVNVNPDSNSTAKPCIVEVLTAHVTIPEGTSPEGEGINPHTGENRTFAGLYDGNSTMEGYPIIKVI